MAEPKLPKLPKSKLKPAIQPNRIVGSSAMKTKSGRKVSRLGANISSKNIFSNLQQKDPKLRNVPGLRTVTNLMSVFATPRNEKRIRRELQLLRNTLVETFEIAKLLRTSLSTVGDNKRSGFGKKGAGIFGGILIALAATWDKITNFVSGTVDNIKNIGSDALENLKSIGDSISNFTSEGWENLKDSVSEGLTGLKEWFSGLPIPTLKETGDAIGSAITAIGAFFQLINPVRLGENLASKWFGGKKDENVATVNESDDTSGGTGDGSGDNQEEEKDNSLIASTNLSGLGNVKSPLEGLTAGGFTGKTGDNKDGSGKKLNLSEEDFKMLGYGVSGEAGPGKDKAAVAASILNRVASKDFPNSVSDVVLDKDQYEAITKGTAFHDKELVNFLKSDEGQKEIIEALEMLQGRTDFKGQSQLKNRVASEDPMADPLGNFYHYYWQGDPNRSKPKDWQMPDYNQFIKQAQINGQKTDVSSINEKLNSAEIVTFVMGGNEGAIRSVPKKTRISNTSSPASNSPQLAFLPSSNVDSSNLACKATCNIRA